MQDNPKIVFVLGAGFTKEFDSSAPLLNINKTNLGFSVLLEKYKDFPNIKRILEGSIDSDQNVNVESLLTRLSTGMPFDYGILSEPERRILYDDVRENFFKLIENIKVESRKNILLEMFSKYAIENSVSFVTFNYDTILDEYLWKEKGAFNIPPEGTKYFHPDGGYGFFCRPSSSLIADEQTTMDRCSTFLYKLHGSLNWRIKIGAKLPYTIDSLVHDEQWLARSYAPALEDNDRMMHLEKYSFIISPILDKSEINSQFILKAIWSSAYKKLQEADKIVFIGYSMPTTDIAARFLFKEALRGKDIKNILVISNSEKSKKSYQEMFPGLDKEYLTGGAEKWILENCSKSLG